MSSFVNYKFTLFFLSVFLLSAEMVFSQTGPGGVGNTTGSSTLKIWMRADLGPVVSSGKVSQWTDQSGSGNNFTMATVANQPSFATNVFNGYPAVRYIAASSNYFSSGFSGPNTGSITIVLFAKGSSYQSLVRYQDAGGTFLVYPWEVGGGRTFITSSDGGTGTNVQTGLVTNRKSLGMGRYRQNLASTGFQTFLYGSVVSQQTSANAILPSQPFFSGRYNPGASEYPDADVSELIIYYSALNEAQKIIVENYLAAKYDTLLTANDLYTMDAAANGNYDHDMAGIGQASDGSNQTDSRGTSVVEISNASGMTNGEFFLWGKNNIGIGVVTTSNMPTASPQNVQTRWAAEWRVSEVGDVGTTNISFDLTGITPPASSGDLRLLIDTDNDGLFSDEVNGTGVISGATNIGGNVYQFSGINIADARRFTLGSISPDPAALPIELIDFKAFAEGNTVNLTWATATEKNNKEFQIYRSADGTGWTQIGTKEGSFTTSLRHDYSFIDLNPFAGLNYYKLRNVDVNASYKESGIVAVNASLTEAKIYMLPSSEEIVMEFNDPVQTMDLELTNVLGKKLTANWVYKNGNTIAVSTGRCQAGVYFIKYSLNGSPARSKKLQLGN